MAKTKVGKKHPPKLYKAYDLSSGLKRLNQFCPKCGVGVYMSKHKDRRACGKCGYSEFSK